MNCVKERICDNASVLMVMKEGMFLLTRVA